MSRWWKRTITGTLGLVFWTVFATLSWAQPNNASINANANVLQPLTVAAQNDLDFGNVFPGVNKTVAITDAAVSGRWQMTGAGGAEVDLSFTLPANLSDGGGNNLPIVFAAGDAGHNTANDPSTATTFDPGAGATANLTAGPPGQLWVWVGGTVQPAVNQPAGLYTGTVTLTVNYTGN